MAVLLLGGTAAFPTTPEVLSSLPTPDDVFVIASLPRSDDIQDYFTPDSLLLALPKLVPADIRLPTGGGLKYWQSGVIVKNDKTVIFWRTCGDWFIAIDTPTGTTFYAIEKENSQQGGPAYPPQGVGSADP